MSEFMNIVNEIIVSDTFQTIFKILLITVLAGIIGYERENSGKPAGFRTYVLVGISSVLVMICGIDLAKTYGSNDPSRMPAQLLSGIGFIGAGTILSNGFKVRGLTTAASLLAITCIGLSVGAGLYTYAIFATLIVYVVLRYTYILNSKLDHMSNIYFSIDIEKEAKEKVLENLNEVISDHEMAVHKMSIDEIDDIIRLKYFFKVNTSNFDENQFITDIVKIKNVKKIDTIKNTTISK